MNYDKQILDILLSVGERGISIQALAKHVYNSCSSFFFTPDREEIYQYVVRFLRRNSRAAQPLVERTERRGRYRLNTRSNVNAKQLMLDFRTKQQPKEPEKEKPAQDLSLSLF